MKTALALIAFVALTIPASAVEYVTLAADDATVQSKQVSPNSLVEIVGAVGVGNNPLKLRLRFASGTEIFLEGLSPSQLPQLTGQKYTGLSSIEVSADGTVAVTFKITPESEINVVAPGTVLVLPENTTGNFDVIIEKSDDLVNWAPFFSQTVNSATESKFFRTRVVKTP